MINNFGKWAITYIIGGSRNLNHTKFLQGSVYSIYCILI